MLFEFTTLLGPPAVTVGQPAAGVPGGTPFSMPVGARPAATYAAFAVAVWTGGTEGYGFINFNGGNANVYTSSNNQVYLDGITYLAEA